MQGGGAKDQQSKGEGLKIRNEDPQGGGAKDQQSKGEGLRAHSWGGAEDSRGRE